MLSRWVTAWAIVKSAIEDNLKMIIFLLESNKISQVELL